LEAALQTQDVDLAERLLGLVDQVLQVVLGGDVGRDGDGAAPPCFGVEAGGDLFAGPGLARRDHHLGAMLGHPLGDGLADAARRAGDDRHLAGEVEEAHGALPKRLFEAPTPPPCWMLRSTSTLSGV
jgi:hypothetical protein